ncbi:MAG: HEPN domain-containing protein [Gemmatimonadota bacterium]
MSDPDHADLLLEVARKDLRALEGMNDPSTFAEEIFGFHAQQSVEKAIKAWLSLAGQQYPRTHDLEALLVLLEDGGSAVPDVFWDLVDLSDFAVQLRYESYEYEEDMLDRASILGSVRGVVERVENELRESDRDASR